MRPLVSLRPMRTSTDPTERLFERPDRVFTSRSEYRISHRADNADLRLTPLGHKHGIVSAERWETLENLKASMSATKTLLRSTSKSHKAWAAGGVAVNSTTPAHKT